MAPIPPSLAKAELARRSQQRDRARVNVEAMNADLFQLQLDFVNDPAKRKTLVCGRRAGKTHSLSRYLVKVALARPGANCLYVALTKPYAVNLMWSELQRYCDGLGLGVKYDNLRHVAKLDNGSRIIFGGVSSKDEREKLRGFYFDIVICDETGSFGPYLAYLLEDVLQAALLDFDGTLVLAGTPSPQGAGAFFDAAHNVSGGWKNWHWTVCENPKIPQWANRQDWQRIAKDFLSQVQAQTPPVKFRREYLGSWERDQDSLLYRLDPAKNLFDELPNEPFDYVIGADTGYVDCSAIVVLAASRVTDKVYVVDEWSKQGVLIDEFAGKLADFARTYRNAVQVIDPANKQLVESMRQIYQLPLEAADKLGKRAHIDMLNTWLHLGRVKFRRGSPTYEQISILEWNARRTAESEMFPADRADSLLYAFTRIYNWNNSPESPRAMTELERAKAEEQKMIDQAVKRARGVSDDPLAYNEPEWSNE